MQLTQGPYLLFLGSRKVFLGNEKIGWYESHKISCTYYVQYLLHTPVTVTVGVGVRPKFLLQSVVEDLSCFLKGQGVVTNKEINTGFWELLLSFGLIVDVWYIWRDGNIVILQ